MVFFLESQIFGLMAKGDVQLFNCIVSVEQHKCTVAQSQQETREVSINL